MGPRPGCRTRTPLEIQVDLGIGGALPREAWTREVTYLIPPLWCPPSHMESRGDFQPSLCLTCNPVPSPLREGRKQGVYGCVPSFPSQVFGGVEWREEGRKGSCKERSRRPCECPQEQPMGLGESCNLGCPSRPHPEDPCESWSRSLAKRV